MDPLTIVAALLTASGSAVAASAWDALRIWLRRLLAAKFGIGNVDDIEPAGDPLVGSILLVRKQELTLEERLGELTDLMERSATLVAQVSAELEARATTAKRLQEEARQAEELASINREQAEAIRKLMDAELAAKLTENSTSIRKDVRKDAIKIGVGSFFAGGGLTLLITLLVHPLH